MSFKQSKIVLYTRLKSIMRPENLKNQRFYGEFSLGKSSVIACRHFFSYAIFLDFMNQAIHFFLFCLSFFSDQKLKHFRDRSPVYLFFLLRANIAQEKCNDYDENKKSTESVQRNQSAQCTQLCNRSPRQTERPFKPDQCKLIFLFSESKRNRKQNGRDKKQLGAILGTTTQSDTMGRGGNC